MKIKLNADQVKGTSLKEGTEVEIQLEEGRESIKAKGQEAIPVLEKFIPFLEDRRIGVKVQNMTFANDSGLRAQAENLGLDVTLSIMFGFLLYSARSSALQFSIALENINSLFIRSTGMYIGAKALGDSISVEFDKQIDLSEF